MADDEERRRRPTAAEPTTRGRRPGRDGRRTPCERARSRTRRNRRDAGAEYAERLRPPPATLRTLSGIRDHSGGGPTWPVPSSSPAPAHPIGKLSGALAVLRRHRPRRLRHQGGARAGRAWPPTRSTTSSWARCSRPAPGQITARQAAVNAGIPMTVPATTINKVCLSGLNAIYLADQMIQAGEADIVVAGGMESMTQAPYLLPGARAGYRIGDKTVVDSMMYDGLFCAFDQVRHGRRHREVRRLRRPRRASPRTSWPPPPTSGRPGRRRTACFDDEIVPVEVPQRKGDPVVVERGRGRPRRHHRRESSAACAPPSTRRGNITAGNAWQISDGGAAVIVISQGQGRGARRRAPRRGRRLRPGGGPRPVAAHPAVPGHQAGARQGGQEGGRRRPVRAQRGVRRRRPGVDGRPRHHRRGHQRQRRAPSPSATPSACRAPAWRSTPARAGRRGGGLGAAALCGGGGQGDAAILEVAA